MIFNLTREFLNIQYDLSGCIFDVCIAVPDRRHSSIQDALHCQTRLSRSFIQLSIFILQRKSEGIDQLVQQSELSEKTLVV